MTTVFLVDDHRLFLSGVKAELEGAVEIVGDASDVDEAIDGIRDTRPEVVLVDVHMPGGGGLTVIENVLETNPEVRFLALSVSDAAEDVIAMIRAGARGYVTKSISPEELVESIARVQAGDAVFSPRLAGFVLDAFADSMSTPIDPELDQLTPREKEVLRQIARGYSYKQVARRLSISVKTVETYRGKLKQKLKIDNSPRLSRFAMKWSLAST